MESPQNQSQPLTRLLHLKRFEAPPPGFHRRFRARVMTRIEMEREWAELPWFHRALTALTRQRGLALANGVALAGVAFLGVATFHIAHTVVNEEDEFQIYAALPLPSIPSREPAGLGSAEGAMLAQVEGAVGATHSLVLPASTGASWSGGRVAAADPGAAPGWLFDPPSGKSRKAPAPRFVLPGSVRSSDSGQ
ncbi:MAG: hypothetical protein JNL10_14810 [Verrucomicrobiales bacterium]|nr:hypothetical protein [Verrucomicrobiales bacterium]